MVPVIIILASVVEADDNLDAAIPLSRKVL